MTPARAMFAEFVGTFALTFVGAGAIIVTANEDLLAVAAAHGLILAVMVSATMHISGGQINPAVSIALGLIRKQSWSQTGLFVLAQLVGAVLAAAILKGIMSGAHDVDAVQVGATLGTLSSVASEQASLFGVMCLEFIATFFLMFVIMGTAVDEHGVGGSRAVGGFAIGLTLAAAILCIGPLTGASLNPARSFGPALIAGAWDMHLAYWLAPILGAAVAAVSYQWVFRSTEAAG